VTALDLIPELVFSPPSQLCASILLDFLLISQKSELSTPVKKMVMTGSTSSICYWTEASSSLAGRGSLWAWRVSRRMAVRKKSILMAGCHLGMGEQELSVWGVRSQQYLSIRRRLGDNP
jgi:hypothetical protein